MVLNIGKSTFLEYENFLKTYKIEVAFKKMNGNLHENFKTHTVIKKILFYNSF